MSGIGQIKPNPEIVEGRLILPRGTDLPAGMAGLFPIHNQSASDNRKSSINDSMEAARPKVNELLEQMQSDPEARALVGTFLLSQMVGEESQWEEEELAAWQRQRQKREGWKKVWSRW
jgi:hypothetical protein